MLETLKTTSKKMILVSALLIGALTLNSTVGQALDVSATTAIITCSVFLSTVVHYAKTKLPPLRLVSTIAMKSLTQFKWSYDHVNGIHSGDAYFDNIGEVTIEVGDLGYTYFDTKGRSIRVTGSGSDEFDISFRPMNPLQETQLQAKIAAISQANPDLTIGSFNVMNGLEGARIISKTDKAREILKLVFGE